RDRGRGGAGHQRGAGRGELGCRRTALLCSNARLQTAIASSSLPSVKCKSAGNTGWRIANMTRMLRPLLICLVMAAGSAVAQAQTWPDRPIKSISSRAAGGVTDVVGRIVADQLSAKLGQPIIYENRPGGGNVIGTQAAARSAPYGYSYFFATAAALVTD